MLCEMQSVSRDVSILNDLKLVSLNERRKKEKLQVPVKRT